MDLQKLTILQKNIHQSNHQVFWIRARIITSFQRLLNWLAFPPEVQQVKGWDVSLELPEPRGLGASRKRGTVMTLGVCEDCKRTTRLLPMNSFIILRSTRLRKLVQQNPATRLDTIYVRAAGAGAVAEFRGVQWI